MKPEYKLKYAILASHYAMEELELPVLTTDDEVEELWDESDNIYNAQYEFRQGDSVTDIPCDHDRHYESYSVAAQCPNGEWVGWTYWYGGGKHGEPESVDWMEYAYDVECFEEEKLVVVQKFSKKKVVK